ncbi:MAG: tripartite tricarboxylate transporter substrate-binding protein [Alphaproteobacteria bacterium]
MPYRGGGPAVVDLVAGHIQALFVTLPAAIEHIRAGRLRALAVTSAKRVPALPEVPSIAESGFAEFEVSTWQGILAPAGTSPAAIRRLSSALESILAKPKVAEQLAAQGFEVTSRAPPNSQA